MRSISQLASMSDSTAALQAQADSANQAAKKHEADNQRLKQVNDNNTMTPVKLTFCLHVFTFFFPSDFPSRL